jgi:uncharacterized repeat protein (TIGR03803 family)
LAVVCGTAAVLSLASAGASEQSVHEFRGKGDGSNPQAGLIADVAGNFYGTSAAGGGGAGCNNGKSGCGTVYKITNRGKEKVLYAFQGGCDGALPFGGVVEDLQGNLYGTTSFGGVCNSNEGYGTVFKLSPNGSETVLYAFQGSSDGEGPIGNLTLDSSGNLYGTTEFGGDTAACGGLGCGVVFKVTPSGQETVLYAFQGSTDGFYPLAGVVMDRTGNLFGTAAEGGSQSSNCFDGCGTVFKIAPEGTETTLYAFQGGTDGWLPRSGLMLDSQGNLYGTTSGSAGGNAGTVFEVAPNGSESVLYSFQGGSQGSVPWAGVVMDGSGNLFGTTSSGGGHGCKMYGGCGIIFELTAQGQEQVLHAFHKTEGHFPAASLLIDSQGNLYGTTVEGGKHNRGVVFELKP